MDRTVPKDQVGEPDFSEGDAAGDPSPTREGVVCVRDPQSRGVGHRRHARVLPLLLVSVNDEQRQEEEDHQHEDHDARDGPHLVGVGREGRAGSA